MALITRIERTWKNSEFLEIVFICSFNIEILDFWDMKISKSKKYFRAYPKNPVCLIFVYMTLLTWHCLIFNSALFWMNPNHLISYFCLSCPSFAYSRIVKSVQRSEVWIRPIPSGLKFIFEIGQDSGKWVIWWWRSRWSKNLTLVSPLFPERLEIKSLEVNLNILFS